MDDPTVPALIGRLFLAGPLVVVPLGLRLLPRLASPVAARLLGLAVSGSLPAGIVLAIAFLLPPGPTAGLLAVPWLLVASLGAAAAALDALAGTRDGRLVRPGSHHAVWAALVFLVVGAGNALSDRLGVQPFGFAPLIVLLTAVHFTFAGFALVLVGALLVAERPARWLGPAIAILVSGMPVTAVGFFGVRPAVLIGALLVAAGGMGIGRALLRSVRGSDGLPRLLRGIAGLTLLASMPLAALYAAGDVLGIPWLDIPMMARTHGAMNVLGFALPAVVGLTLERRTGR